MNKTINYQILLAGYGGQGIVFLVKLLAQCAFNKGYAFIGTENHGMSQRGGSVRCDIKIGDFSMPVIDKGQADLIVGLDENECLRHIHFLNKDACIVVNAKDTFPQLPFSVLRVDANEKIIKQKLSNAKLNIYLLGKVISSVKDFPFSLEDIQQALKETNESYADENIQALLSSLENMTSHQ